MPRRSQIHSEPSQLHQCDPWEVEKWQKLCRLAASLGGALAFAGASIRAQGRLSRFNSRQCLPVTLMSSSQYASSETIVS